MSLGNLYFVKILKVRWYSIEFQIFQRSKTMSVGDAGFNRTIIGEWEREEKKRRKGRE